MRNARNAMGFSLLELLVASAIGLILLMTVGSIFITGYSFAAQRSLQLMLAQDANDVLRMMKEDVLRAGYASGASSSFVLSGATKTIYLNSPSAGKSTCIAYGYDDGSNEHYRSYYLDNQTLRVFSTKSSVLTTMGACKGGQSALNEKLIKVTRFEVDEKVLSSGSALSQYLTFYLEVATIDDAVSTAKTVTVKTRNWN